MANNYTETSTLLALEKEQHEKAKEIIAREIKAFEDDEDEGYCGIEAELEQDGVWFHQDESANVQHLETIARALIEELEIDEPFFCAWAYTCSKPRLDEFGGGAFCIKRGQETYWVDAMSHVEEWASK